MRKKPFQQSTALALFAVLAFCGCRSPREPEPVHPQAAAQPRSSSLNALEARLIAKRAYLYGVSILAGYRTTYAFFIDPKSPRYKGPFNTITNRAHLFTPLDIQSSAPTSDTADSFAGLDLRAEPVVVTVPRMEEDRYFALQLVDMNGFNFASIGTRTTGNHGGTFLIAGPSWQGSAPAGIQKTIHAETAFVNVFGRTQILNASDLAKVKRIQSGYKVQPLHAYLHTDPPPAPPPINWPVPIASNEQTSLAFFQQLAFLLQFTQPPNPSETDLYKRLARIGVIPSQPFDAVKLSPQIQNALKSGMDDGQKAIDVKRVSLHGDDSMLFGSRSYLKNDYLARATGAQTHYGAPSREEMIRSTIDRDAEGQPLDGAQKYTLHFAEDGLPPVNAFWSLTMYNLPAQLLVKNPLHRYAISSTMLPQMKHAPNGGLTIYIQAESPGKDKLSNWLPSPKGHFLLEMRYYWPKPDLLNGQWKKPELQSQNRISPQP